MPLDPGTFSWPCLLVVAALLHCTSIPPANRDFDPEKARKDLLRLEKDQSGSAGDDLGDYLLAKDAAIARRARDILKQRIFVENRENLVAPPSSGPAPFDLKLSQSRMTFSIPFAQICGAMRSGDPEIRLFATQMMSFHLNDDEGLFCVDNLIHVAANDPALGTRNGALFGLSHLAGAAETPDVKILNGLAAGLRDPAPENRYEAVRVLSYLGKKAAPCIESIVAALQDADPRVSGLAEGIAAKLSPGKLVSPDRIEEILKRSENRVLVYGITTCPWTQRQLADLAARAVPYEFLDAAIRDRQREALVLALNHASAQSEEQCTGYPTNVSRRTAAVGYREGLGK